jgi:predicted DNA-binding transcriptional regulator YafY
MDETSARLLRLLTLLAARAWWTGPELTERLEITDRTLRRDINRLRGLGYPVAATPGRYGGYRLGAGGRLPPLVLDDDEAVAVAVGLRAAAGGGAVGLETAALAALTKLEQVLPVSLRERVDALRAVTIDLRGGQSLPNVDLDHLVIIALACGRSERLRFAYRTGDDAVSDRLVEPFRLVYTERRWYVVAYDNNRADWRTFRVDRMSEITNTRARFTRTSEPDAAGLVAEGLAVAVHPLQVRLRFHLPAADIARMVSPTVGIIETDEGESTVVRIGGEADWIARYVIGFECAVDVLDSDEVRTELRAIGERLMTQYA